MVRHLVLVQDRVVPKEVLNQRIRKDSVEVQVVQCQYHKYVLVVVAHRLLRNVEVVPVVHSPYREDRQAMVVLVVQPCLDRWVPMLVLQLVLVQRLEQA